MEYSPKKMQNKLNDNNFNFKKKFGQNFIVDENVIKNIVTKSNIDKDTLVIEIGPGAGSLTCELAKYAKNVLCYEIDKTLDKVLADNLKEYNNVSIKFEDFLKANVEEDLKEYVYKKVYIVANLPYYITTPIVVKVIESKLAIDKIVIMVQKEVGDRFKAKTSTKEYNSLSVFLQYYFDIKKILDVSKNVFIPKPNVDSIVLEMTSKKELAKLNNENLFFELVRDSFVQKRKTLKNNLKNYDLDKIESVLKTNGFDLSSRAEQLPIDVFIKIANELGNDK